MATERASGAKMSKGRTDSTKARREVPGSRSRPQRDNTPEARQQRAGTPKTHPTRAPIASRKSPAGRDTHNVQQGGGARRPGGKTIKP